MASNKGRAFFALYGYHFNPDNITHLLGLEPTSINNAGANSNLDKPVISSWEFSTDTITSDNQEVDIYKLIDDEILKKSNRLKTKLLKFVRAIIYRLESASC